MNFNVKNTKVTFKLASTSYLLMYPHLPVNNSKCRTRLAVVFIYLVTLVAVSKAVSPQNHSNLRVPAVKSEGYSLLATVRRSSNRKWHPQQLKRRQQKNAPPSSANNITGINSNTTGSFPPENSSTCCLPEQWNSIGWDTSEMLVFMIFLIWIIFACLLFFICACCHPRMHRGNLERDLEARGFDEALQNYIFMTIVHAQQMSEMIREKEKLASLILENTKMLVTEECLLLESCEQKAIVSRDIANNEKFDLQSSNIETCSASIRHASHFVNIPECNTKTLKRFPNGGPRLVPNSCVICLESYSLGDHLCWSANVGCSHAFHFSCIEPWCCKIITEQPATMQIACPCCRQDFVKFDDENERPPTESEELSSSSYDEENRP